VTSPAPLNPFGVVGSTEPRIWTPPLRELTPETSYGFDVIEFADGIGKPLDPWQRWAVIHGGELLPDGRPRFRKILILVARQNGKTHLLVILALFWLFIDRVAMILGTSTKLDYAAESWRKARDIIRGTPRLFEEVPSKGGIREANGEQVILRTSAEEAAAGYNSRYKIAASNEEGGRSMTIARLILDELRQHHDYSAYNACVPATNAVLDAQVWALSNAGSARSVVLNDWVDGATEFIKTGEGDARRGLFEWSAPEDASPLDAHALAQANPNLGRRLALEDLLGDARTAMTAGGAQLVGFKTEYMCIRVKVEDPAIDLEFWRLCGPGGEEPQSMSAYRDRIGTCFDVSPDGEHATLAAAAVVENGRVRVEIVESWSGADQVKRVGRALRQLIERVRPVQHGWFPSGPAASYLAELEAREDGSWPPAGIDVAELRGETPAVCMAFARLVKGVEIEHPNDPLINHQIERTEKQTQGDAWRFTRNGSGHCDAVYAVAGAVHIARTMPAPAQLPPPLIV
jgi:hypothetical protein